MDEPGSDEDEDKEEGKKEPPRKKRVTKKGNPTEVSLKSKKPTAKGRRAPRGQTKKSNQSSGEDADDFEQGPQSDKIVAGTPPPLAVNLRPRPKPRPIHRPSQPSRDGLADDDDESIV